MDRCCRRDGNNHRAALGWRMFAHGCRASTARSSKSTYTIGNRAESKYQFLCRWSSRLSTAKIRTIIVDDEPLARSNLLVLSGSDPEIEVVAQCGSGVEAVEAIRRLRPDLLFLDVQMPECDGFDVLEMLGKDLPRATICVTAYDQYALRAFEAGALDDLRKPFDNARFDLALNGAKQRIRMLENRSDSDGSERIGPRRLERIVVKRA